MSIHINQVLDYLDTHMVCRQADSMDSLLGMLYEIYAAHNCLETEEIRAAMGKVDNILDKLQLRDRDEVIYLVCRLCEEHEQLAFSQGVLAGMLLMTEVNRLP